MELDKQKDENLTDEMNQYCKFLKLVPLDSLPSLFQLKLKYLLILINKLPKQIKQQIENQYLKQSNEIQQQIQYLKDLNSKKRIEEFLKLLQEYTKYYNENYLHNQTIYIKNTKNSKISENFNVLNTNKKEKSIFIKIDIQIDFYKKTLNYLNNQLLLPNYYYNNHGKQKEWYQIELIPLHKTYSSDNSIIFAEQSKENIQSFFYNLSRAIKQTSYTFKNSQNKAQNVQSVDNQFNFEQIHDEDAQQRLNSEDVDEDNNNKTKKKQIESTNNNKNDLEKQELQNNNNYINLQFKKDGEEVGNDRQSMTHIPLYIEQSQEIEKLKKEQQLLFPQSHKDSFEINNKNQINNEQQQQKISVQGNEESQQYSRYYSFHESKYLNYNKQIQQFLESEIQFSYLYNSENFQIQKSNENHKKFRITLEIPQNLKTTFQLLCNPEIFLKFNKSIESVQILSKSISNQYAQIELVTKPFGNFYKRREFNFIRQFVYDDTSDFYSQNPQILYLLDIQQESNNDYSIMSKKQVGSWNAIWEFKQKNQDSTTLTAEILIDQMGFCSQGQNEQIALSILQEFQYFNAYIFTQNEINLQENQFQLFIFPQNKQKFSLDLQQLENQNRGMIEDQQFLEVENQNSFYIKQKIQDLNNQIMGNVIKQQNYNSDNSTGGSDTSIKNNLLKKNNEFIQQQISNNYSHTESEDENELTKKTQQNLIYLPKEQKKKIFNNNQMQSSNLDQKETKENAYNKEKQESYLEKQQQLQEQQQQSVDQMKGLTKLNEQQNFHSLNFEERIEILNSNQFWNICLGTQKQSQITSIRQTVNTQNEGHYLLKNCWVRDEKNGGLIFVNKDQLKNQKKALKFMLKKIGKNILTGQNPLKVPMPVYIFEKRSNLQRFSQAFGNAPIYLDPAANCQDEIYQFYMTITFFITIQTLYLSLEGPFNPILGETFQCYIDGNPLYFEQISHHPPICAWQLYGKNYNFSGSFESTASMHMNSFTGRNTGTVKVYFKNTGNTINLISPVCRLSGLTVGERKFGIEDKIYSYDLKTRLFSIVNFGVKNHAEDFFEGEIVKLSEQFFKEKFLSKYGPRIENKFKGYKEVDIVQKYGKLNGIWHNQISYNNTTLWNNQEEQFTPYLINSEDQPIASDSIFRKDIAYWQQGNETKAQENKDFQEQLQRNDKKLREKCKKKKK